MTCATCGGDRHGKGRGRIEKGQKYREESLSLSLLEEEEEEERFFVLVYAFYVSRDNKTAACVHAGELGARKINKTPERSALYVDLHSST